MRLLTLLLLHDMSSLDRRYHLVIRTIFQQEQQLATQVETLQQIETKHQRLKARSLLLPAHQGNRHCTSIMMPLLGPCICLVLI